MTFAMLDCYIFGNHISVRKLSNDMIIHEQGYDEFCDDLIQQMKGYNTITMSDNYFSINGRFHNIPIYNDDELYEYILDNLS